MRLIDADAIPWTDLNDNPNSDIKVLVTFADKVNKMPTIEPEDRCSECDAWNKYKNYSQPEITEEDVKEYCRKRCLKIITSDLYHEMQELPSAQRKTKNRRFEEIVVTYPNPDLCSYPEYKGKPYFSIKYEENEEHYIGYGTYNPTVFSMYLKRYFMQSAQPGQNIAHKINLHQYPAAWICSECGSKHFDFSDKYCSYCGADVRESKDE